MASVRSVLFLCSLILPACARSRNSLLRGLQEAPELQSACAMPLEIHVHKKQKPVTLALGISVRTDLGDSQEYLTGELQFLPQEAINVTYPLLPCDTVIYGLTVRTIEQSSMLLIDYVVSTFKGARKQTITGPDPLPVSWGKTFVQLVTS